MGSLNDNNRKREVHRRKSLAYRKGKLRLRPLSIKQLEEKLSASKDNRQKDSIRKELARKSKMGLTYNRPQETAEEA